LGMDNQAYANNAGISSDVTKSVPYGHNKSLDKLGGKVGVLTDQEI